MKPIVAALLLLFAAGGCRPVADGNSPEQWNVLPCRMARDVSPVVQQAAQDAWTTVARGDSRRLVVNPRSVTSDMLPLFVVKDSLAGETDPCAVRTPGIGEGEYREFDAATVLGMCSASDGAVICSEAALRALLEVEDFVEKKIVSSDRGGVSATLAYLFAHEFAHIRLGHAGTFAEGVARLDLGASREEKLAQLAATCNIDQEQLEREKAADAMAFEAMTNVFGRSPYRPRGATLNDTIAGNADIVYFTAKEMTVWAERFYGSARETPYPRRSELCGFLSRSGGSIVLPVFGGSHPHLWNRLAGIMDAAGQYLDQRAASQDDALGGSDPLLNLNRFGDQLRSRVFDAAARQFCRDVAMLENGSIDCGSVEPEEEGGINIDPALLDFGNDRPSESTTMTVAFQPGGPYAPPPPARAHALFFELGTHRSFASREIAMREATRIRETYEALLRTLDDLLRREGGHWIFLQIEPLTVSENTFTGGWSVAIDVNGFARAGAALPPPVRQAVAALERWGRADEITSELWQNVRAHVWVQFDDPGSDGGMLVRTVPLSLDSVYDFTDVRSLPDGKPSQRLLEMISFVQERLQVVHGRPFTVRKDQTPHLRVFGSDRHQQFSLPASYVSKLHLPVRRTLSSDELLAMLEEIFTGNDGRVPAEALGLR